jgi:hypothetical protein
MVIFPRQKRAIMWLVEVMKESLRFVERRHVFGEAGWHYGKSESRIHSTVLNSVNLSIHGFSSTKVSL